MNCYFDFFSLFNNAYNNKLQFFYCRYFPKLEIILRMFVKRGLILGFAYKYEKVVVHLRYLNDVPFFRLYAISTPRRQFIIKKKQRVSGRFSGNEFYIVNSPKKGLYFSDAVKENLFFKEGGIVLLKIVFFNEKNCSKKNSFI